MCPEAADGLISTKFCTAVEVVDVITGDKFFWRLVKGRQFCGGVDNRGFPLTKPWVLTLCCHDCAASDQHTLAFRALSYVFSIRGGSLALRFRHSGLHPIFSVCCRTPCHQILTYLDTLCSLSDVFMFYVFYVWLERSELC